MQIFGFSPLINYLQQYDSMYPGIEAWWESRVIPDVASGQKVVFRFDRDVEVHGLGVVDLRQGKLCHLSLVHAVRGTGLGRAILALAGRELRENGYRVMWCHGPENMVGAFAKWSGAVPREFMGYYGRSGERDVRLEIVLPGLSTH